jgi:hypothetical protein
MAGGGASFGEQAQQFLKAGLFVFAVFTPKKMKKIFGNESRLNRG